MKVALDYLNKKEGVERKVVIDKNNTLSFGDRKFKLDNQSLATINWYGGVKTFEYIPFWKVINSYYQIENGKTPSLSPEYFKDKIVFIGVTATSLFDIKSTPLARIYPGIEVTATVLNNLIDGKTIQKASFAFNFWICLLLGIITYFIVIKIKSSVGSIFSTFILFILYLIFSTLMLSESLMWVNIVFPTMVIILTFSMSYVLKYILKSKDFEYTYKLATTDGLTGLYNHRYFQDYIVNQIERYKRTKEPFSFIMVDIDFFKKFNDTYGHQAGDTVLRQVATTLKENVRSFDMVARYGGEEMAVVLESTDIDEAVKVANKLCKAIADRKFRLSDTNTVNVNISLGVSTYPMHGESPSALIEFSDQGLYRAKENGRNQVGSIPGIIIPPKD